MKKYIIPTILFLLTLLCFRALRARAATVTTWFDASRQPQVSLDSSNVKVPEKSYWGAPCQTNQLQAFWITGWGDWHNDKVSDCTTATAFGEVGNYGVKLTGTSVSYELKTPGGGSKVSLYPIPRSNSLLGFTPTSNGNTKYIYRYNNFPDNFSVNRDTLTGLPIAYNLKSQPFTRDTQILQTDGVPAEVFDSSLSYSANGDYIVANAGSYQLRIDVANKTARMFGESTLGATTPSVTSAINQDGTLSVIADNNTGKLKLYNLAGCAQGENSHKPEVCQNSDLWPSVKASIPNLRLITQMRFVSDDVIELYTSIPATGSPTGNQVNKYYITAPGSSLQKYQYLALGDSFASGEGAYSYKPATDTATNRCHTSSKAYPYLIQQTLRYNTTESIACSGAQIKDTYNISSIEYSLDHPQATDIQDDSLIFDGFLPGYRRQSLFVGRALPSAMTLSVGGNNIGFSSKISRCVLGPDSCFSSEDDKAGILKELKAQFDPLVQTYKSLKNQVPGGKLYVVGYPEVAATSGSCALNVHLDDNERKLSNDLVDDLDSVIERAAKKAGIFYVDVSGALSGHRFCETNSADVAVNGLTAGNNLPLSGLGPIGNESYHPNALGHQLEAEAVMNKTSNLTAAMPAESTDVTVDNLPSKLVPTASSSNVAQPVFTGSLSADKVKRGDTISSTISTEVPFTIGENFKAEIHSDPVEIGTAIATGINELTLNATIPADITPGMHSIHLYGKNIAGEPVDIYKDILVIASDNDYDGDGIANTDDTCSFVPPANLDVDKDGIDDACDDVISAAPAPPPVVTPPPITPPPSQPPAPKPTAIVVITKIIIKLITTILNLLKSLFK